MDGNRYGELVAATASQSGLITTAQLRSLEVSEMGVRWLVGTGRLARHCREVYRLPGAVVDGRLELHALLLSTAPSWASHRSAAAVIGLPGLRFGIPEITTQARRPHARPCAVVHQTNALPESHRRIVDGIPVTSVARTLLDLTAVVSPKRAERALDHALARRMVTVPALTQVLAVCSARGRRRLATFRSLLDERTDGYVAPESELEARFVELARVHCLPEPERQVDLGDSDGWVGRVDFRFPGGVIVEVDGYEGHSQLLDRRADEARDRRLAAEGWQVLRFGWTAVTVEDGAVAATVRAAIERHAA
ncbi:MAG TPA: type IV toxin-antitoxin system AbiEi family antitoxin domain-containing protein [Acidimicrobiia bacterium]